jgi:hypothetical protein
VKAISEFVIPSNFSEGFVEDTSLRFHAAVAASYLPARRPTRGSETGAPGAVLLLPTAVVEIAGAHPAADNEPIASDRDKSLAAVERTGARQTWNRGTMIDSSDVAEWIMNF